MNDVTRILASLERGDTRAADELLPLVYAELRKLAAAKMACESPGQTLQPTALVHEAWLRLAGEANPKFKGRAHFFAAAAEAMRRILIDNARRKRAVRHGGNLEKVEVETFALPAAESGDQLLLLHETLDCLAAVHPVEADVVKLRYFVGMTNLETAQALGLSERTIKNYWTHARAWLFMEMQKQQRS